LIAVDGGDSTTVTDAVMPRGGDWMGDRLIFSAGRVIFSVAPDGSQLRALTTLDESRGEFQHVWPRFLPDGRRVLLLIRSTQPDRRQQRFVALRSRPPEHERRGRWRRARRAPAVV